MIEKQTTSKLHKTIVKEQVVRRHFDESKTFTELFIELIRTHK